MLVAFLSPSYCAAIFLLPAPQRLQRCGEEMCRTKMPPFIFVVSLQSCHLARSPAISPTNN
jgi:hypothetical protein